MIHIHRQSPVLGLDLLLSLIGEYTTLCYNLSVSSQFEFVWLYALIALQCQLLLVSMSDTLSNWHCGPDAETISTVDWRSDWHCGTGKVLVCKTLYSGSVGKSIRPSFRNPGLNHGWI